MVKTSCCHGECNLIFQREKQRREEKDHGACFGVHLSDDGTNQPLLSASDDNVWLPKEEWRRKTWKREEVHGAMLQAIHCDRWNKSRMLLSTVSLCLISTVKEQRKRKRESHGDVF
jgi:hypothetical protein